MSLDVPPVVGSDEVRRFGVNRPLGETVLLGGQSSPRLREILQTAGFTTRDHPQLPDVLSRLAATAESNKDESLLVIAADLQLSPVALLDLVDSPADRTAALTLERGALRGPASTMQPVRVAAMGREILSAGTSRHAVTRPGRYAVGVLRVRAADRAAAASVWRAAAQSTVAKDPAIAPFDLALLALLRGGVSVEAVPIGPYAVSRGSDHATGAPGSPWQQRLRGASRGNDGAFSTAVIRPVSRRLTALGLRLGWKPNLVTLASLLLGLLACGLVALDSRAGWVAAAVLLQASLVVDCVDGEIARFTRTYSALGGWLDAVGDRVKEFAMVGVVAWVGMRREQPLWGLAVVLLALLAVRHVEDYCYARRQRSTALETGPDLLPLEQLTDLGPPDAPTSVPDPPRGRAVAIHKVKQVLHLPIAERYLIMSIGLLLFSPVVFLWALAIAVTVALLWTELGRTAAAMLHRDRFRAAQGDAHLVELLDLGVLTPVGGAVGLRLTRLRLGWQLPWLMLAAEAAMVLVAAGHARAEGGWAAYIWLAAVCWHRYDVVYRLRETGRAPAPWVGVVTLGSPLRIVLLAVVVATGAPIAAIMAWGALALITLYAAEAAHDWIGGSRASRPERTEVLS